jgi:hypothetical protein
VGRNEDNSVFAHSISSGVIHSTICRDAEVILAIQNWIFGCDYQRILREEDLALLPRSRRPAAPRIDKRTAIIEGSHRLKANVIRHNGEIFAKNPRLLHMPGTHPEVRGENRWYRLLAGRRAEFWKFAASTVD